MASSMDEVRASVGYLLEHLSVRHVFWVDDVFGGPVDEADLLVAQARMSVDELRAVMPELTSLAPDAEVRKMQVRDAWSRLDEGQRTERGRMILGAGDAVGLERDREAAQALAEIVGSERLTMLSPSMWDREEARLLADGVDGRFLVLFDQDLSKAGGTPTSGMVKLRAALARDKQRKLVCGLFTGTVDIKSQHTAWEQLAREQDVPHDRFLVIAKQCLQGDFHAFARMLKLVAEAPDWVTLKAKAKEIIRQVAAKAASDVEQLSVFDLDDVVFKASYREGMWEPDMLFRLHALFERRELRKLAMQDAELEIVVERLRRVSRIPTESEEMPESSGWRLQQLEMYEDGEYVNQLRLPVEVGDIFENTEGEGKKGYVLLGQPCDLSVRSDGKRAPERFDLLLVEIAALEQEKAFAEKLDYYGSVRTEKHFALLRKTLFIDPIVLDLCAFNQDGESKIKVGAVCPAGVTPAWRKRFDVLRKRAERVVARYSEFGAEVADPNLRRRVRAAAMATFKPMVGNGGVFRGTVTLESGREGLAFNCRRVRRLTRSRALALSLQYAANISRPAFETDLGGRAPGTEGG